MTTRLFIETTYHPAFRYGGWGVARDMAGAVTGVAGGERNTTAGRIDLMALIAGLTGQPAGSVALHSASPGVLAAARLLAAGGTPEEDLDLHKLAAKALEGRVLTVKAAGKGPGTPAHFLSAWAEVGQDKAKGSGRFSAAIPKSNLAKLALP
jgi:hypothetical protein